MNRRDGFLIIDALIGLVIISIAMLAYLSLSQKTTEQSTAVQYRQTATFLAQSALSIVKNANGKKFDHATLEASFNDLLVNFNNNYPNYPNYTLKLTTGASQEFGTHTLTPFTVTVTWPIKILSITRTESFNISGYHTD